MHFSILSSTIILLLIKESQQFYKQLYLESPKLCSQVTKRKLKYDALIVKESKSITQHSLAWKINSVCKFEVQSRYSNGGIVAVIQSLNLRKNYSTGECIDYVQFKAKKQHSIRLCGTFSAVDSMDPSIRVDPYYGTNNSFIDPYGELDVVVFIDRSPLKPDEKTELLLMFTSYMACNYEHPEYISCNHLDKSLCINKKYFIDGYVNCPEYGCADEINCTYLAINNNIYNPQEEISLGDQVIVGSLSTLFLLFALFCLITWTCKKHKLFCWSQRFAHPESTVNDSNESAQTHIMELNETVEEISLPTAPVEDIRTPPHHEEEKDLPPSYDSLFPNNSR